MRPSTKMVRVYPVATAAAVIGLSKWAIYRMVKEHRIGWISARRGNGRRLFVDADVVDAIAARQAANAKEPAADERRTGA